MESDAAAVVVDCVEESEISSWLRSGDRTFLAKSAACLFQGDAELVMEERTGDEKDNCTYRSRRGRLAMGEGRMLFVRKFS